MGTSSSLLSRNFSTTQIKNANADEIIVGEPSSNNNTSLEKQPTTPINLFNLSDKGGFSKEVENSPVGILRKQLSNPKVLSDLRKLTAIRLILNNDRFVMLFLDVIGKKAKREFYDLFEELECMKKLFPQQSVKNSEYNFLALINSCRCLHNCYVYPEEHEAVCESIRPLLQYPSESINSFDLHSIINYCQNALLVALIPEFDHFVASKPFQKSKKLTRSASSNRFHDELEECLYASSMLSSQLFLLPPSSTKSYYSSRSQHFLPSTTSGEEVAASGPGPLISLPTHDEDERSTQRIAI